MRWYYRQGEDGTVHLERCHKCVDLLAMSRLTPREQQTKICDIHDIGGGSVHRQLRILGNAMLADPYGWITLYGGTGSAKSLLLTALVAEFCKRGTRAIYYHAKDLEQGLFADMRGETANREFYKDVPVLAIDELGTINMKSDWVMNELFAVLDHRYRHSESQVTLLAMNADPHQWAPDAWLSRMQDGRFNRQAGDGYAAELVPGLLFVEAPDVRPILQREKVVAI